MLNINIKLSLLGQKLATSGANLFGVDLLGLTIADPLAGEQFFL